MKHSFARPAKCDGRLIAAFRTEMAPQPAGQGNTEGCGVQTMPNQASFPLLALSSKLQVRRRTFGSGFKTKRISLKSIRELLERALPNNGGATRVQVRDCFTCVDKRLFTPQKRASRRMIFPSGIGTRVADSWVERPSNKQ